MNRFSSAQPTCPYAGLRKVYAGLPIVPIGAKLWLIFALLTTHHLAFLVGFYIYLVFFCVCCIMSKRESVPNGYIVIRQSTVFCAGCRWLDERY